MALSGGFFAGVSDLLHEAVRARKDAASINRKSGVIHLLFIFADTYKNTSFAWVKSKKDLQLVKEGCVEKEV